MSYTPSVTFLTALLTYSMCESKCRCVMPGFHHCVAVLPLPFCRCLSRCRFRTPLPLPYMPWFVGVDDWLASYGTEQRKNRTRSYFNGRTVTVAFCRLRLQRHGIFLRNFYRTTEFYNGKTAKRQQKNGNGMVETGHYSATQLLQLLAIGTNYFFLSVLLCGVSSSSMIFLCLISSRCLKYSLMAVTVSFSRTMSAAFSAIITWLVYELPLSELGMIDASMIRRFFRPRTLLTHTNNDKGQSHLALGGIAANM